MKNFNSSFLAVTRIIAFVHFMLVAATFQQIVLLIPKVRHSSFSFLIPRMIHKVLCKTFGFEVIKKGRICKDKPVLYTSNHISYIDILILGSLIQGSFVAKSEIAGWPVFGWLSKLQKTVFLDRKVFNVQKHKKDIEEQLKYSNRLIIFPEATTSDGQRVLQFKSSLYSVAEVEIGGKEVLIQPVTIAYTKLDGVPMGRRFRPLYAWIGDLDMFAHAWHMIGLGKVTVEVIFHNPVKFEDFGSRKKLAQHCEKVVREGLSKSYKENIKKPKKKKRFISYAKKQKDIH